MLQNTGNAIYKLVKYYLKYHTLEMKKKNQIFNYFGAIIRLRNNPVVAKYKRVLSFLICFKLGTQFLFFCLGEYWYN